MASSWDTISDCGSDISRATSDITAEATGHAQQRMVEREIEQRDFQEAKKYGSKERHHTYADRWVFKHNGSVFVTNETSDILITCLRPRPAVAPEELHASVLRAIAPSIEAVVAKSVTKALGARQPDAPVRQLAPPPAPPRSVSPAARPRSVSRSRSPRPARSVPVMVFREDATVRPLRVVVTVPARSTLSSVKDALADLLNARDGVVFELRETKKGGCLYSTSDLLEVENIDHDDDLVAYELDAGLANERTVNVYMGTGSMCPWAPNFGQAKSEAVSYDTFGWPICMAFAAGATCGDVRRDVAAWFARFSLSPHLSDAGLGARVRIVSTDGMTGKRDLPADNDERLPADVQALVVAWTEDEDLKEFIDARELYAVDDHVSAHDYAYPNLAPGSPTPSPSCTWATIRG